jgi:hypothetical protein
MTMTQEGFRLVDPKKKYTKFLFKKLNDILGVDLRVILN